MNVGEKEFKKLAEIFGETLMAMMKPLAAFQASRDNAENSQKSAMAVDLDKSIMDQKQAGKEINETTQAAKELNNEITPILQQTKLEKREPAPTADLSPTLSGPEAPDVASPE